LEKPSSGGGGGGITQGLACAKPWVQFPALGKNKTNKNQANKKTLFMDTGI
jgi:hypothetical protein